MMQRTIGWKLAELDRILNDPTAPMEADRVWSLLDDVSASVGIDEQIAPRDRRVRPPVIRKALSGSDGAY